MEQLPNTDRTLDSLLSIETIILEGLAKAVHNGWITEDEKHVWLDAYIDCRNNEVVS